MLCARGAAQVALEVQLARVAPGELRRRQERYRAAGVHGAWFVPPDRCPPPSRELPAFPLEVAGDTARVGLGAGPATAPEAAWPLDAFVAHLLGGRVRFEAARRLLPPDDPPTGAVTAPDACRRCGVPFEHVAGVSGVGAARPRYRIGCRTDREVSVTALRDLWAADRRGAWAVADAVRRLRRDAPRLSPLAPRRCPVVGESYLTALCPSCGAAQGDGAVDRLLTSLHPRVPVRVPIPPAPLTFHPLDGRPPRAAPDDGGRRPVPAARWHLEPGDAAGECRPAVRCAAGGWGPSPPA